MASLALGPNRIAVLRRPGVPAHLEAVTILATRSLLVEPDVARPDLTWSALIVTLLIGPRAQAAPRGVAGKAVLTVTWPTRAVLAHGFLTSAVLTWSILSVEMRDC